MHGLALSTLKIVRFGEFEADLAAGELRRGDAKVRLSRQPVELLTALLERPGQVVTRDELRARLWRDDTFVDFEHGLNAAVNRLRDALGDSAQAPRFVETLPGRGYRFIQAVEAVPEPAADRAGAEPLARRSWAPWAIACALILAASVLSIRLWPTGPVDEPVRFAVTLPAGVSLDAAPVGTAIALSPDGRQVAFVANSAGRLTQLWLRRLDALSAQPLAGTEGAVSPFWSPDGRFLRSSPKASSARFRPRAGRPKRCAKRSSRWPAPGTTKARSSSRSSRARGRASGGPRLPAVRPLACRPAPDRSKCGRSSCRTAVTSSS